MMSIEFAFLFILPLISFIGGIFFFYKAYNYWSHLWQLRHTSECPTEPGGLSVLSGKPKAENQLASFVERSPCIYSRLLLEYLEPKRKEWISINTFDKKERFSLTCGGKKFSVDPTNAKFDSPKRLIFQEAKKTSFSGGLTGEIQQLGASSRFMRPIENISSKAEPYGTAFDSEPFSVAVYAALETEPRVREMLYKYNKYRKRATIETIKESDSVVVIGNAFPQGDSFIVKKGKDPFIISSDTADNIIKHVNGRAVLSIFIGIGLVLVSFALFYFILS